MKNYKMYDDIADAYVIIKADSLEKLIEIIMRDYGKAYLPHMHYECEVTGPCRIYGMSGAVRI
jgi:hypothetical protein